MKYDGGLHRWRHEDDYRYKPDIEMNATPVAIALALIIALALFII